MMTYYDDIRKVQDLHLPWEILTDINILFVGASGLIGRALVDSLMQLPDMQVYGIWFMRKVVSCDTRMMNLSP